MALSPAGRARAPFDEHACRNAQCLHGRVQLGQVCDENPVRCLCARVSLDPLDGVVQAEKGDRCGPAEPAPALDSAARTAPAVAPALVDVVGEELEAAVQVVVPIRQITQVSLAVKKDRIEDVQLELVDLLQQRHRRALRLLAPARAPCRRTRADSAALEPLAPLVRGLDGADQSRDVRGQAAHQLSIVQINALGLKQPGALPDGGDRAPDVLPRGGRSVCGAEPAGVRQERAKRALLAERPGEVEGKRHRVSGCSI